MKFLSSLSRARLSIPGIAVVPVGLSCDNVASVLSNYTSEYRELLMTCTLLGIECALSECVECAAQEHFNCRIELGCECCASFRVRINLFRPVSPFKCSLGYKQKPPV